MTRREVLLPAGIAATVLAACLVAFVAAPGRAEAAFPGENGSVVFQGFRGWDDPSSLYSRDPDTVAFTRLTNNDGTSVRDNYPVVSPDGTRVVFVRTTVDYAYDDLYVANTDGTGDPTNVTDDPTVAEFGPAWSPDARRIAFAAYPTDQYGNREGSWEVYAVDADGSDRTKITDNGLNENHLAWSPDGTRIAFSADGGAEGPGVYVMDADGSSALRIADGYFPSWSPDGRKLAYSFQGRLYTMDADGSDRQQIATDRFEDDPSIESVYDSDPAWSPDGTRVAFARTVNFEDAQGNSVYTTNLDGSDLKIVAGYFPRAVDPDWGPVPGTETPPSQSPPETTIISGPHDLTGPSATFDFVSSRPDTTFECSLDAAEFSPCKGPKQYAGLQDGEHTFRVRAKASGGEPDPTPAARTWTVEVPGPTDGTAPTINALRPAPGSSTRDRTPTVRATVRDGESELAASNIKLRVDGARKSFAYDPDTDRLSRTMGKLSYGRHSVRVVAEDSAGNATSRAWSFKVVRGR